MEAFFSLFNYLKYNKLCALTAKYIRFFRKHLYCAQNIGIYVRRKITYWLSFFWLKDTGFEK